MNLIVSFFVANIIPLLTPEVTLVLCGILIPIVVRLVFGPLNRGQQDMILNATKGAFMVIAAVAKATPMTLDDQLAAILKQVTDEMGRALKPAEIARVQNIALAIHTDGSTMAKAALTLPNVDAKDIAETIGMKMTNFIPPARP